MAGNGRFDRAAPDTAGLANLAVLDGIGQDMMIKALDAGGRIVGTCTFDEDSFSVCPG